ncbi:MAG: hypothetical protein ACLQUY_06095, partial [Ktedonobacterales bacterium]
GTVDARRPVPSSICSPPKNNVFLLITRLGIASAWVEQKLFVSQFLLAVIARSVPLAKAMERVCPN